MPRRVPLNPVVENITEHETFTEKRIRFTVEEGVDAVGVLCIPKLDKQKYPVVICLQGHSRGMHVSLGRRIYEDEKPDTGDRDFAIQAVNRGMMAFALEQRGMGERRTDKVADQDDHGSPRCYITATAALLLGRTLLGERVFDVSRAIDFLYTLPEADCENIICLGNSGGGTATYYAACFDERIKVAIPSCSVCTYKDSIGAMRHCVCNFLPGIAKYMDMGDLAVLIAPRKLIVVNGAEDHGFPKKGVDESYEIIEKIYKIAGVPQNCALVTGNAGHRFYADLAWKKFDEL